MLLKAVQAMDSRFDNTITTLEIQGGIKDFTTVVAYL